MEYGRFITVVEVVRELGFEPTPELTWRAGMRMATLFAQIYGAEPRKELRPKTNDGGSHCHAVYLPALRDHIVSIVNEVAAEIQAESARQGDLFIDEPV